jgi:hypothetical protein
MKTFASPSFFRTFDFLLSRINPGQERLHGMVDGVEWTRERHSFAGPSYSLAVEVITLMHPGRDGWTLMVTKEFWWAGAKKDLLKSIRWARPLSGKAGDVIAWFRHQQMKHESEQIETA